MTAGLQNSGTVPMVLPVRLGAVALVAYGLILLSAGGLRVFRSVVRAVTRRRDRRPANDTRANPNDLAELVMRTLPAHVIHRKSEHSYH